MIDFQNIEYLFLHILLTGSLLENLLTLTKIYFFMWGKIVL